MNVNTEYYARKVLSELNANQLYFRNYLRSVLSKSEWAKLERVELEQTEDDDDISSAEWSSIVDAADFLGFGGPELNTFRNRIATLIKSEIIQYRKQRRNSFVIIEEVMEQFEERGWL